MLAGRGEKVEKIVYTIEGISVWLGRAFGWCILILTLAVAYEVFVRYVLNSPTVWSLDMQIQMYGALFLMTGPYALAQGAHVRGDFLYRLYPVKWQATSDLILYLIFFIPGMFALVYAGYTAADESWRWKEVSLNSPAGIQIYYLKTLVPIIGFFMLLQGFSEMLRCWKAIKTGIWMPRLDDVKETEDLLAEATHEVMDRGTPPIMPVNK